MPFDTPLTPQEERRYQAWLKANRRSGAIHPQDTGADYDLRGAFKAGVKPMTTGPDAGHWPDTFKKPSHDTYSDESIYSSLVGTKPGTWGGKNKDQYIPFDKLERVMPQDELFDKIDRIHKLGQTLQLNDPSFRYQDHQAKELSSGPFAESAARHKVWKAPTPEQEALQEPLVDPVALGVMGGGALAVKGASIGKQVAAMGDDVAGPIADAAFNKSKGSYTRPTLGGK